MSILDLWLPIVVASLVCFFMSAAIWVLFKWHNADYRKLEREEAVGAALKGAAPGYYLLPYAVDQAETANPEVRKRFEDGPVAYITVAPNGMPSMPPKMIAMIVYFAIVSSFCAYMVTRTLAPGADYLAVFQVAGTVAFVANSLALIPESIWFNRPWSITLKNALDAVIYAGLTGGIFGWLV